MSFGRSVTPIQKTYSLLLIAVILAITALVACASGLSINMPPNPPPIETLPPSVVGAIIGSGDSGGSGSVTSGSNSAFGAYLSSPSVADIMKSPIVIPGSVLSNPGNTHPSGQNDNGIPNGSSGGSSTSGGSQSGNGCKCGIGYKASGDPVDQTCKCTWVGVAAPKITPRITRNPPRLQTLLPEH